MLVSALRFRARTRKEKLWAVRHVDLEIAPGDTFGIIGRNGSGKSTTLQMVAGVTAPTEGLVSVRGRVAPLISVGVGFHLELTGRENIYVNGTILGMPRAMIDARLDAIIDFAEIEEFIDTPVKFYSSGMVVRLGFAVAVQAEPDILLVDEVLAVGDFAFQAKCYDRMNEIRRQGTTIIVVSHNLHAVRMMCDRTLLLHQGRAHFLGETDQAVSRFHEVMAETRELEGEAGQPTSAGARFVSARLVDAQGNPTAHVATDDTLTLDVEMVFDRHVENPVVGVLVDSELGTHVFHDSTLNHPLSRCPAGSRLRVQAELRVPLTTGTYSVCANLLELADESDPLREPMQLGQTQAFHFYVSGRNLAGGVADLQPTFTSEITTEIDHTA
jgi:ABC-2 type transport system ATP-binding protein